MRSILEVRTAKDSLETPEAAIQLLAGIKNVLQASFLQRLLHAQPTITLEIASLNQSVHFVVTCDREHENLLKSEVAAHYPTAVINPLDDYLLPWSHYGHHAAGQLVLTAPNYLPLKTYLKFQTTDPLATVLGVLGKIPPGSASIIQITLSAAPGNWSGAGRSALKRGVSTDPLIFKAHPQATLIEEKLSAPAFHAGIRLLAIAPGREQAETLLSQTASTFGSFALADANSLKLLKSRRVTEFVSTMIARTTHNVPLWQYLNLNELATIYHFPGLLHAGLRNLAWGKTIRGEAPDNLPIEEGATEAEKKLITFYAKTEYRNQLMNYGIRLEDRRRHFYILGKSGTGKSTLIAKMAIGDMQNGRGLAVIDPHGDLCEILLDHVPTDRLDDIIYLDPSDTAFPFHLNPLEVKKPEYKELAVSNILSIFTKIWANVWSARMEYILRNALATLVEVPGSTMLDIPNLLTDDKFRAALIKDIDPVYNRVILDFWNREYNQYNDKFRNEAIAPILNKVGQFISGPTIRRILQQPTSTINVEDIMNSGKILLLNLSQGKIGEDNAALLGAMFITQFQQAAMNRINTPEEARRDFFLYVDEFQNFATESFIKILSEARKYHLDLILANQYTAQLPEEIQKAIFGNVGTTVTFVVGADDATRIMSEFGTLYTQDDLVNLGKYQIINKISIDNRISNPFPAYTLPVPSETTPNREQVLSRSHQKFERQEQAYSETTKLQQAQAGPSQPPRQHPGGVKQSEARLYSPGVNKRPEGVRPPQPSQPPTHKPFAVLRDLQPPRSDLERSAAGPRQGQGRSDLNARRDRDPRPKNLELKSTHRSTTTELDSLRRQGFRPTVVGCFLKDKKILLGYQQKHDLWQLPQGGVDNKETIESALFREMSEELAVPIYADKKDVHFLGSDQIEFPPEKHAAKQLATDEGKPVTMKGKHYFFFTLNLPNLEIKHSNFEYDRLQWFPFDQAVDTLKKTVRGGKLRITLTILETLHHRGLI